MDLTNYTRLESVTLHTVTFLACKDHSIMKIAHESITNYMVSLMNLISSITSEISNSTISNANIISDLYLEHLKSNIIEMEASHVNNSNISNIINSINLIADAEDEMIYDYEINPEKLNTKSILNKIIEFDNSKNIYVENINNTSFSLYITDLESVLSSFIQKSNEACNLLEEIDELRLASEIAMTYFRKELNLKTDLIDDMFELGINSVKDKIRQYILNTRSGDFKHEY